MPKPVMDGMPIAQNWPICTRIRARWRSNQPFVIDLPRVHSQISAAKVTARSRGRPALPGNSDSHTCSRQDTPITVGSHFGSRRTALQRDRLPSGIGRSALTCEDAFAGTGCEGPSAARAMQEVKDHLRDRNMSLTCGNVELRGFEPLTPCMPMHAATLECPVGIRPVPCGNGWSA